MILTALSTFVSLASASFVSYPPGYSAPPPAVVYPVVSPPPAPVVYAPPPVVSPPPVIVSVPAPSGFGPFVYTESIAYTQSVLVNANSPAVVPHYTRQVKVDRNCDVLMIDLTIPFVGNDANGARSRIWLRVNGQFQSDATKYNHTPWELHPIHLKATLTNVVAGTILNIEVLASVDRGTLNIPHYNTNLMEANQTPSIAASLNVVGLVA